MSDVAAHKPLTIGLIGLSPDGLHLIESMSGGGPFRVALAWDSQRNLTSASKSLGVPVVADLNSFLAATAVDVFWLARPCGLDEPFAELLLQTGKPIVGELPLGLGVEHVESLLAVARSQGLSVLSHCPRRSNDDFLRAQSAVRSGELGTLRAAKWISWSFGLPPTSTSAVTLAGSESQTELTLIRLLAHAIDQLLQLIPGEPSRVVAFGEPTLSKSQPTARSIQAIIEFRGDMRAEIDLRLDSPVPLQTGWLLAGDRGGLADGHGYRVAADGEVFDIPASTIDSEPNSYAELAERLCARDDAAADTDRTVTMTRLLAAIQVSAQSGEIVSISP